MDLPTPSFRPARTTSTSGPAADASVREATVEDADGIGRVQSEAWRASYDGVLPAETLLAGEAGGLAEVWRAAITEPPTRGHRVLVALAAGEVCGFVAIGPSDGAESSVGEVLALEVGPASRRAGHGSRLLNAAADRLRQLGFEQLVVWVLAGDDVRRAFLTGAGLAADGSQRTLQIDAGEDGAGELREVRLAAALGTPA
jgi:ribosomal protein S18 acetylase RimI-like enzyme